MHFKPVLYGLLDMCHLDGIYTPQNSVTEIILLSHNKSTMPGEIKG